MSARSENSGNIGDYSGKRYWSQEQYGDRKQEEMHIVYSEKYERALDHWLHLIKGDG